MALQYFNLSTAGTGGDGSSGNPWRAGEAVAKFALLGNNDTAYMAGRLPSIFSGNAPLTFTNKTGITVQQWPGMPRWCLSGATGIPSGWTGSGTVWNATIATGLSIEVVTFRFYDPALLTANYSRWVGLAKVANAAACTATANSYYYDSATGAIRVNCAGLSAAPTTYSVAFDLPTAYTDGVSVSSATQTFAEIEYVLTNPNTGAGPFVISSSTSCTLTGAIVDRMGTRNNGGGGYCIQLVDCSGCTVRNCWADWSGYHNIGIVGNTTNTSNTIHGCISGDCGAYQGATSIVTYVGGTADITGGNVRNNIARSSHLFQYGGALLPVDNGYASTYSGYIGIYAHTAGTTGYVRSLLMANNRVICGMQWASSSSASGSCEMISCGNVGVTKTDQTDAGQYPHITSGNNCTYENYGARAVRPSLLIGANRGSIGDTYDFRNSGFTESPNANTANNSGMVSANTALTNTSVTYSGCKFLFNQIANVSSGLGGLISTRFLSNETSVIFDGCIIVWSGTISSGTVTYVLGCDAVTTSELIFRNSIFVNASTITGTGACKLFAHFSEGTLNTTQLMRRSGRVRFEGNVYVGFGNTQFWPIANFGGGTAAAWTATTSGAWGSFGMDAGASSVAYSAGDWDANWNPIGSTIRNLIRNNQSLKSRFNLRGNGTGYGPTPYGPLPAGVFMAGGE